MPAMRSQAFDISRSVVLDDARQLAALDPPVRRVLSGVLDAQSLADRICPVEMEDGLVALFALAGQVGSDQADELAWRIVQCGYTPAQPERYVLPAPLLLALSRGQWRSLATEVDSPASTPTALSGVFQDLVEWGVRQGASDMHLNVSHHDAESEVRYTLAGRYIAPERFQRLPTRMLLDMLAVIWMDIQGGNGAVFDPSIEQQGSLLRQVDGRRINLRWASLAADRGPSVCLRFLELDASLSRSSLENLGYRADQLRQIERVMRSEGGAIVLAGTVGSGKSTTLASLMARLPAHHKVITLEEPVEYRIERAVQNTIGRYLDQGAHDAYATKLRTIKRSAMSDVLLGEIRDRETGRAFMDLAGSGVNVYTTVHAPSAVGIPERLASEFIGVPRDFLATPGILKLLIFQALLPTLCRHCALEATPEQLASSGVANASYWSYWLDCIESIWDGARQTLRIRNEQGCVSCLRVQLPELAGYAGRTVAAECLEPALLPEFLAAVRACRVLPTEAGSGAMAHAMQKALLGEIDPRDIEVRFMAFETLAMQAGTVPDRSGAPRLLRVAP
ncbi:Flp pilus assembly complex ATPase component TadA [Alcaligenaceae bacterium CGII-47]|nr:Flp pilus assembly complex ATPase component TadA [Alcaligenaceae bacterium CGII-47]